MLQIGSIHIYVYRGMEDIGLEELKMKGLEL